MLRLVTPTVHSNREDETTCLRWRVGVGGGGEESEPKTPITWGTPATHRTTPHINPQKHAGIGIYNPRWAHVGNKGDLFHLFVLEPSIIGKHVWGGMVMVVAQCAHGVNMCAAMMAETCNRIIGTSGKYVPNMICCTRADQHMQTADKFGTHQSHRNHNNVNITMSARYACCSSVDYKVCYLLSMHDTDTHRDSFLF